MIKKSPLAGKAVLVTLNIRCWTSRKLDRRITDEVNQQHNAAADAGRFNKLLIPKKAFDEIYGVIREARRAYFDMTMPWHDDGSHILPSASYPAFTEKFRGLRREFEGAVDRFEEAYPTYLKQAKSRMGKAYSEKDYPSVSAVKSKFGFETRFQPFPDVADFRVDVTDEDLAQLQRDIDDALKEPIRRVVQVVEKMATKLRDYKPAVKDKKSGKIKTEGAFRDSLVDNIRELLPVIEAFNIGDDASIRKLTAQVAKELCAVDAPVLREDEQLRKKVAKAAEDILKQANELMA